MAYKRGPGRSPACDTKHPCGQILAGNMRYAVSWKGSSCYVSADGPDRVLPRKAFFPPLASNSSTFPPPRCRSTYRLAGGPRATVPARGGAAFCTAAFFCTGALPQYLPRVCVRYSSTFRPRAWPSHSAGTLFIGSCVLLWSRPFRALGMASMLPSLSLFLRVGKEKPRGCVLISEIRRAEHRPRVLCVRPVRR